MWAQACSGLPSTVAGRNWHLARPALAASSSLLKPEDFSISDWITLPSTPTRKRRCTVPSSSSRRDALGYSGFSHWAALTTAAVRTGSLRGAGGAGATGDASAVGAAGATAAGTLGATVTALTEAGAGTGDSTAGAAAGAGLRGGVGRLFWGAGGGGGGSGALGCWLIRSTSATTWIFRVTSRDKPDWIPHNSKRCSARTSPIPTACRCGERCRAA